MRIEQPHTMDRDDDVDADGDAPLPTLSARAWAFGLGLRSDDVLPSRFAVATGRCVQHLFADLAPAIAPAIAAGDAVVALEYLRGDADPRQALDALATAGVTALIGVRFDPEFAAAAHAAGIVTVPLDAPGFIHTGDRIRIDLEGAKVVNLSSGDRAAIRHLGAAERAILRMTLTRRARS